MAYNNVLLVYMSKIYSANHGKWKIQDSIVFEEERFYRKQCPTENGIYIIEGNELNLHWYDWPVETLYTTDKHESYFSKDNKFILKKVYEDIVSKKILRLQDQIEIQEPIVETKKMDFPTGFVKQRISVFQNMIDNNIE